MATVIHFDISADDIQRAKQFYEQLFGWNIEKFSNSPQDYYIIETQTATGEKSKIKLSITRCIINCYISPTLSLIKKDQPLLFIKIPKYKF